MVAWEKGPTIRLLEGTCENAASYAHLGKHLRPKGNSTDNACRPSVQVTSNPQVEFFRRRLES